MEHIRFTDPAGSFILDHPDHTSYLYFPLASESGLKSAITPTLGGDAKLSQVSFLLEPTSSENLHNNLNVRNFWFTIDDTHHFALSGTSAAQMAERFTPDEEDCRMSGGLMWHKLQRTNKKLLLNTEVTTFIPVKCNVEIMLVSITNNSASPKKVQGYSAVPIYGRSADNLRDHRHVTSLLHRIHTDEKGVYVCPTMSFDERGHQINLRTYYVTASFEDGSLPISFFPTVEDFLGEGGTYQTPLAVLQKREGKAAGAAEDGKEAIGAMKFAPITLQPSESAEYIVLLGAEDDPAAIEKITGRFNTADAVRKELALTKKYWMDQVNVSFHTGDDNFDRLMKWVCFQPFLRRLFGCSFLPHHDYGRGGRGWRDLWQDCLSLLLMDPGNVGTMIEKNFGGVRMDGTNATIIGDGDGNFIADRNGIARVWMDHALWPLMTTRLYIDQTGDLDILMKDAPYFKDSQAMRGTAIDEAWEPSQGQTQRDNSGSEYRGTILEHLLLQQLAAFYEVGEHNIYRLRGADWNDALDMAPDRGESVAFTCAYTGNLRDMIALLKTLEEKNPGQKISVLKEMTLLLNSSKDCFESIEKKHEILKAYGSAVAHNVTGEKTQLSIEELISDLSAKADWLTDFLRGQEWISGQDNDGWYNSYYDNNGRRVEGYCEDQVRMMLTGQVFSIMGGIATEEQIKMITAAADRYLYNAAIGGYRLNTDFKELKSDMGRMFGFAYGEKENGAVFCHMAVMYANALYGRGFAREGWKSLSSLSRTALDFETSRIYPGIPEYFRGDGRGMYNYLTGCASWYMMTMITEVFGVKGDKGNLMIAPRLLSDQFDEKGCASLSLTFAGKKLNITFENASGADFGSYAIQAADSDQVAAVLVDGKVYVERKQITEVDADSVDIKITLG